MPLKMPIWGGQLLNTSQLTTYHVGDDGDFKRGMSKEYEVLTTGQFSGNSNLDVATYAGNQISFIAPDIIADAANGLVTFLNADVIMVKGSASNNVAYTIASGGATADHFHVTPNVAAEGAGAYISLYKRAAHTNACVIDKRTGLMWSRTTSNGERIGPTAGTLGALLWYDPTTCFELHPVAGDLSIVMPGNILRITGGAAEITRYHVGDLLVCAGFATAVNLLPGYRVTNVATSGGGADLDITLWTGNQTLIAEVAAGTRTISLICRSCFGYAAAANAIALAGYTDWRIPNCVTWVTIMDYEQPMAAPDAIAFPVFPNTYYQCSTTSPNNTAQFEAAWTTGGTLGGGGKLSANYIIGLVRAGP